MNSQSIKMLRKTACFKVEWDSDLIIRQPNENDIPVLTELDHEDLNKEELSLLSYPDSIQRYFDYLPGHADIKLSKQVSCVVSIELKIIAFCLLIAENSDTAHLYNIHVAYPYRRKGIATKMIQRGITILADKYKHISLDTEKESDCYTFFKKLEFEWKHHG